MEEIEKLRELAKKVDSILKEELARDKIPYDKADVRIYDVRNVGVMGDGRTYENPAEITLFSDGKFIWNPDFLARLSTRITNEVNGVNRVVYVTEFRR